MGTEAVHAKSISRRRSNSRAEGISRGDAGNLHHTLFEIFVLQSRMATAWCVL